MAFSCNRMWPTNIRVRCSTEYR